MLVSSILTFKRMEEMRKENERKKRFESLHLATDELNDVMLKIVRNDPFSEFYLLGLVGKSVYRQLKEDSTKSNLPDNQLTHLSPEIKELDVSNKKLIQLPSEEKLQESEKIGNSFEYDIFICHSSKDKSIVETLITDLKRDNISYWVDIEQITYGDSVTKKIEDGLKNSKYIVPCLSKNLNTSDWTNAEYSSILNAEFSGNSERKVIPLKLDNCENSDIPLVLRDKKRVKYSNKDEFCDFIEFLKSNHK